MVGDTKSFPNIIGKEVHLVTFYPKPFNFQADMVAGSILIPSVALLVCPSGIVLSIVDCHEFTGSQIMPVKADLVICSSLISVSG